MEEEEEEEEMEEEDGSGKVRGSWVKGGGRWEGGGREVTEFR